MYSGVGQVGPRPRIGDSRSLEARWIETVETARREIPVDDPNRGSILNQMRSEEALNAIDDYVIECRQRKWKLRPQSPHLLEVARDVWITERIQCHEIAQQLRNAIGRARRLDSRWDLIMLGLNEAAYEEPPHIPTSAGDQEKLTTTEEAEAATEQLRRLRTRMLAQLEVLNSAIGYSLADRGIVAYEIVKLLCRPIDALEAQVGVLSSKKGRKQ